MGIPCAYRYSARRRMIASAHCCRSWLPTLNDGDWSAAQSASAAQIAWRPSVRHRVHRYILAAASLSILVSASAYWHSRQQTRAAEMARADALLVQVDAGISRAVPQTMEPLVNLVTWGSGPTDKTQNKEMQ